MREMLHQARFVLVGVALLLIAAVLVWIGCADNQSVVSMPQGPSADRDHGYDVRFRLPPKDEMNWRTQITPTSAGLCEECGEPTSWGGPYNFVTCVFDSIREGSGGESDSLFASIAVEFNVIGAVFYVRATTDTITPVYAEGYAYEDTDGIYRTVFSLEDTGAEPGETVFWHIQYYQYDTPQYVGCFGYTNRGVPGSWLDYSAVGGGYPWWQQQTIPPPPPHGNGGGKSDPHEN